MTKRNFLLHWVEHEKSFITSGPEWNTKSYFERKWDNITWVPTGENMPSDMCFQQTEMGQTFGDQSMQSWKKT